MTEYVRTDLSFLPAHNSRTIKLIESLSPGCVFSVKRLWIARDNIVVNKGDLLLIVSTIVTHDRSDYAEVCITAVVSTKNKSRIIVDTFDKICLDVYLSAVDET